jgi:hypothetical protein
VSIGHARVTKGIKANKQKKDRRHGKGEDELGFVLVFNPM